MAEMPLVGVITLEVSDEEINRIAERLSRAVTTEVQVPQVQGSGAPQGEGSTPQTQSDRGLLDAIRQALLGKSGADRSIVDAINAGKGRPGRILPGLPVERASPTVITPPAPTPSTPATTPRTAPTPGAPTVPPVAPRAAAAALTSPLGIAAMAVAVPLITAAVAKAFMGMSDRSLAKSVGEGAEFSGQLTAVNVIRQQGVIQRAQVRGSILGDSAIRLQRESDETRMLWTQITAPIRGQLNNIYASLHDTIQPALKQLADVSAALSPRSSAYQPTPGQQMLGFLLQSTQNAASNPTPFPMLPPAPMRT